MLSVRELAAKEKETTVALRRHFHEYPELSQEEFATMDYIEDRLHSWNIPTVRVPRGGVIATVDSGKPGWTVLVRADIDALAIEEKDTNLSAKKAVLSKNKGVMHACGHDGHMAMALTEAKILSAHTDAWEGRVIFIFEEAEEVGERGISALLRYLRDHAVHIDAAYGTHVMWRLPAGKTGILYGTAMAGAFFFAVKLHGYGGHGSRPDMAKSPIEAFVSIQSELRAYRMRAVPPEESLTYSIGCVNAGSKPNIIPSELSFAGTMRCTDNDNGLAFREFFKTACARIAEEYGCTAEFVEDQYIPVTMNNKELVDLARHAVVNALGEDALDPDCPMWMASETFAVIQTAYPSVLFFTGIQDAEVGSGAPHHTPEFDLSEDGLVAGVGAALAFILAALREKPATPSFKASDLDTVLEMFDPDNRK